MSSPAHPTPASFDRVGSPKEMSVGNRPCRAEMWQQRDGFRYPPGDFAHDKSLKNWMLSWLPAGFVSSGNK